MHLDQARAAGLTGRGTVVGMLDAGFLGASSHAPSATLASRYTDFTGDQIPDADTVVNYQHGHYVATVLAGEPIDAPATSTAFQGGVAPDVALYWGRICQSGSCNASTARAALTQWQAQGISLDILNLSLSARRGDAATTQSTATAWHNALLPALQSDTLIVASTGNDGADHPGIPAALPAFLPQWSGHLLAVAAVQVDAQGNPATLASYSNQCGDSAAWCLVAPAQQYVSPILTEVGSSGWAAGTSMSAPVVSGVAALVKQAHPWMSATNLQQTLLTTAIDLGEPGVDALYGWGSVDAGRAIGGPARFVDSFIADVTGTLDSTFSHAIDGAGGLVKRGDGTLTLSGDNRYLGGTLVAAGTLVLAGNVAGDVQIQGGQLHAQAGRIGGHYLAGENATTSIALGQPLLVGGNAQLDGQLALRASVPGHIPSETQPELLLQADAVSGAFRDITYGSGLFYRAELAYDDTRVTAQLTRVDPATLAATGSLSAAALTGSAAANQIIDSLVVTADQDRPALPSSLQTAINSPLHHAVPVLEGLAAPIHGVQRGLAQRDALDGLEAIADRQAQTVNEAGSTWSDVSVGRRERRVDMAGLSPLVVQTDRFSVDVLHRLSTDGWQIAAGWTRIDVQGDSDDTSSLSRRQDQVHLGLDHRQGNLAFSAQLSHLRGNTEVTRIQATGEGAVPLHSRYDAQQIAARLEIARARGTFRPYAALSHVRHHQDGFSEQGDSDLGLTVAADTHALSSADIGIRANWRNERWHHTAQAGRQQLLHGRHSALAAALPSLQGTPVATATYALPASLWRVGATSRYALTPSLTLSGQLNARLADDTAHDVRVQLGLQYRF